IAEQEQRAVVDINDFGAALDRDNSKRHFVVITEDSDLEALMAAPLEHWRVFLHPSQRKLVERDWNGPVRVTGGAGTGKTVVEDIRLHLQQLCTPQEQEKIQVINIDQWALNLLRRFGYKSKLLYEESERRAYWNAALSAMPDNIELPESFFRAEYERVILPLGCETAEDYTQSV
ncbi:MAG: hypothetical protein P8Y45_16245, partial [Exilibacterium sp.]